MNNTEDLERIFANSYIKPVLRTKIGTKDVFVADGFVPAEQVPAFKQRFAGALSSDDAFPHGCFATIWMSLTEIRGVLQVGVATFEPGHDMESLTLDARQTARVNKTVELARKTIMKARLH